MKAMDSAMPAETLSQFKNGRGFTSQGGMTSIYDFSKQEITLLDREGKRYATLPAGQFQDAIAAAMPQMPKEARAMLAAMKTRTESKGYRPQRDHPRHRGGGARDHHHHGCAAAAETCPPPPAR